MRASASAETYKYTGVVRRPGCIALKIGVLRTGAAGRAVGGKLMELGHEVVSGTRDLPKAKVVKTLNTMTNLVMVNPALVAKGDHDVFLSGNDAGAKAKVAEILRSFGWKRVIDLGDITTARGVEMVVPVWVQLMAAMKT